MATQIETADMTPYRWLRTEDVLVTLVSMDPDMTDTTWLIQRVRVAGNPWPSANALVVRFQTELVFVNGLYLPPSQMWWEVLTTLADALALAPRVAPGQSVTTRYEP
jgi:hypothetical protein